MSTFLFLKCVFQAVSLGLKNLTCTHFLSAMVEISFSGCTQNPEGLLNRMFADRKAKTGMYIYGMNSFSY